MIRHERPDDIEAIRLVTVLAFADMPISRQTEYLINDALRDAGALTISLVVEDEGRIVGHVAFSPAAVGEATEGWYLLGPISVTPSRQGRGIGSALVEAGLDELQARGAAGCVLVGDPGFYRRFGFRSEPGVRHEGVPSEYVLCLPFRGAPPQGEIVAHPAFLTPPPEAPPAPDISPLAALEEALWRTETRFDRGFMERILAPDFREHGASGAWYTREEIVDATPRELEVTLRDLTVTRLTLDTVRVAYVSVERGTEGGERVARRASTWRWTPDGWRLAFHEGALQP